ncbi:MAG TPA: condensation domain-containing protein [Thermoanaerobaculia bacterium]|nr:condensation domain-containing protein [Thermoanaerobaculia bacterium]
MSTPRDLSERRARLTPAQRALLEKRLRSGGVPAAEAEKDESIAPRQDRGPAPASFGQRRLFHFAAARPASIDYNVYYAVGLRGPLDRAALARGVRAVVERHEALHTRFELAEDGKVMAVAAPDLLPSSLPLIDLGGLTDPAARDAEAMRVVIEFASPLFDLRRGPLFRTVLLRRAEGENSLLVSVHHAVIDGWSLSILTRDLAEAYAAGGAEPSSERPLQAADFALWERRRIREGALAGSLSWWREHLAGAPPMGIAWPGRPQAAAGRSMLRLDAELVQSLKALAQRERVTLFITLLAGFKAWLRHRTGQTDLIVGTPMALRARPEAAGISGFLLNVLPLRTDLAGDPTFLELLHRVRDTFLGALSHRAAPIEWLAEEFLHGHAPGALPWVNVLFNMPSGEAGHVEPLTAGDLEFLPLLTGEMGSEPDLTFYAREVAGGMRLDLGFNANLFAPAEAGSLLEGLAALLEEAASCPDRRLSELAGVVLTPAGSEV